MLGKNQETHHRLELGGAAMKALKKILSCWGISISTKIQVVQAMVFHMTICGSESWTLKKQNRNSINAFELFWGENSCEYHRQPPPQKKPQQMDH